MIKTKNSFPFSVRLAAALLSLIAIVYGLSVLQEVIVPMLFSGILAVLLLPICHFLEKRNVPRILAIFIALALATGALVLFFYLVVLQIKTLDEVIPLLVEKGTSLLEASQIYIEKQFDLKLSEELAKNKDEVGSLLKNSTKLITGTLASTTSFLGSLALVPLYIFLFLLYRDFLQAFCYKLFHTVSRYRIDLILTKIEEVVVSYMVGLLLVIFIIGILNTASLFFLGIEHAVFFGFFAAFLVLIPYIGIAIGALLPILMALITKDSAWYAAGVAISFGVVQFLEGNFITPYVVGSKVNINSLAAIVALILFGNLWGVSGLVLALPLTAILKVIFDSINGLKPFGFLMGDAEKFE